MTGKVNVAEHTSTGWGSRLLTPGHYTETLPKSIGHQEQSPPRTGVHNPALRLISTRKQHII